MLGAVKMILAKCQSREQRARKAVDLMCKKHSTIIRDNEYLCRPCSRHLCIGKNMFHTGIMWKKEAKEHVQTKALLLATLADFPRS